MTQPQPVEEELPPEDLASSEAAFSALVLAALTLWLGLVFPAVMTRIIPEPSQIWRFQQVWTAEVDKLMPYLQRLARRGWERTMRQFGMNLPFQYDALLLEQLDRTRNLLVRIPDETYRQVIKSLAYGRDQGETPTQLAQRVYNVLNINGSENWPNRADVIGRTEVNRFFQAGVLAGAERVEQARGIRLLKQWQDEGDQRVRQTHRRVDNRLRPLGEPFEVGMSRLQYPGDPSGFPQDVINCRCDLLIKEAS